MKFILFVSICLMLAVPAFASTIAEIEGLQEAIDGHEAALKSNDKAQVSETVLFPHVQFMPDGQLRVNEAAADLREPTEAQLQWRATESMLVSHENDIAIVRVAFEGTGPNEGTDLGAGLWCFTRVEGQWRITWRHYLGVDVNK